MDTSWCRSWREWTACSRRRARSIRCCCGSIVTVADRLAEGAPPSDIRDSRNARPVAASRWGLLEAGALLLTFFVWPVGVLLAWLSRSWDRQEKVVATLSGGMAFVIGFPLFAP